jgi:Na+/H+ antiporter NhaD/arsenite permease-like protein
VGALGLIFVPIFKVITGMPPVMGVLLGLGILWILTDVLHQRHDSRQHLLIPVALSRIDTSSVLFFLGILLSINALEHAQILQALALWLNQTFASSDTIAILIGIFSAIVDNVPLVAASMGMYDLSEYPLNSQFWQLIAFCAGTGGSLLVIGSAAGVVYMSLERVGFFWYIRRISLPAAIGYFGGIAVYYLI